MSSCAASAASEWRPCASHLVFGSADAPAQDHRPEDEDQQVEPRRPARDLQRAEEARRDRGERLDVGRGDEQAGARRLACGGVAGPPGVVRAQVEEPHEPEHPHGAGQHGRHHGRLPQRGRVAARVEAPAERSQVADQQQVDERMMHVERAPQMRDEGHGQRHLGHPPGERLAAPQVARDLDQREPGHQHHRAARLRDLQWEPTRDRAHDRRLPRPDG